MMSPTATTLFCWFGRRLWIAAALSMVVVLPGIASAQPYIYPAKGQDKAQQEKDRYECHQWAVSQTGFDPSSSQGAPSAAQSSDKYQPSQRHVARGAARGAAVGAVGGAITGDAGTGAAAGAAMGGVVGGFRRRDEKRQQAAAAQASQAQGSDSAAYDRAMAACLTGRGYTVH